MEATIPVCILWLSDAFRHGCLTCGLLASGRTYYVRIMNEAESGADALISDIKRNAKAARKRAQARTVLQRAQLRVNGFYESSPVTALTILLIVIVSDQITILGYHSHESLYPEIVPTSYQRSMSSPSAFVFSK